MSQADTLHIVIINFRTPDYTIDCLKSLEPEVQAVPGVKVLLVDNASGDDSVPMIQAALQEHGWTDWVTFLPEDRNHGFAGGNNVGLRKILAMPEPPPFVLLLNSDTLVHPRCLQACLDSMRDHPEAGMMSCLLVNRDGTPRNAVHKFPYPRRETVRAFGLPYQFPRVFGWGDLEYSNWDRAAEPREVEWLAGAFMLIRTNVLQQIGLLSEEFFFYGEDTEFCHRMWKAGWTIRHEPCATTVHYGGGSSDEKKVRNARREALQWAGRLKVQRLCYGRWAEAWIRLVYLIAFGSRALLLRLLGKRGTDAYEYNQSQFSILIRSIEKQCL